MGNLLSSIFGANWRTTLSSIGGTIMAAITYLSTVSYDTSPLALIIPPKYKTTVSYITGTCTVILWLLNGIAQKDKKVTGGTVQQTVNGNVAETGTQSLVDATVTASIHSGEKVTPEQKDAVQGGS